MHKYNIITLGASGAGKTIFLASLFRQMSLPTKEGIFLEVESFRQQQELNNIYMQIVNQKLWPQGTGTNVNKWCFTCHVKTQELENYPVCQFVYLDYGGGLLTDKLEEEEDSNFFYFRKAIPNADAVIVLIDGYYLLKYIKTNFSLDDEYVARWLMRDLPNTIQLANRVRKNPVHFVITKWDLFEGKYSLKEARKCLETKCVEFKRLVDQRVNAGSPVRLIPVSSVGAGFASPEPDGSMRKNLDLVPKPFQLEILISYVLIDKVVAYYNDMNRENKRFEKSIQNKFFFLLELIPDSIIRGKLLNRKQRAERRRQVNDSRTAFSYLIDTFVGYIQEFEKKYPEANLGGDMTLPNINQEQFVHFFKTLKAWLISK